jgi:hypothetical protein
LALLQNIQKARAFFSFAIRSLSALFAIGVMLFKLKGISTGDRKKIEQALLLSHIFSSSYDVSSCFIGNPTFLS